MLLASAAVDHFRTSPRRRRRRRSTSSACAAAAADAPRGRRSIALHPSDWAELVPAMARTAASCSRASRRRSRRSRCGGDGDHGVPPVSPPRRPNGADRGSLPRARRLPRGLAGADRGDGRAGALLRRRGRRQEGAERHAEASSAYVSGCSDGSCCSKARLDDRIFLPSDDGRLRREAALVRRGSRRCSAEGRHRVGCGHNKKDRPTRAGGSAGGLRTSRSTGTSAATSASTWSTRGVHRCRRAASLHARIIPVRRTVRR